MDFILIFNFFSSVQQSKNGEGITHKLRVNAEAGCSFGKTWHNTCSVLRPWQRCEIQSFLQHLTHVHLILHRIYTHFYIYFFEIHCAWKCQPAFSNRHSPHRPASSLKLAITHQHCLRKLMLSWFTIKSSLFSSSLPHSYYGWDHFNPTW